MIHAEFQGDVAPCCWRATSELQPGMVLARPIVGAQGSRATLLIGAGGTLTEATIAQLVMRGIECAAVLEPVAVPLEVLAAERSAYQARLQQIFGSQPDPSCQSLYTALLDLGPARC